MVSSVVIGGILTILAWLMLLITAIHGRHTIQKLAATTDNEDRE